MLRHLWFTEATRQLFRQRDKKQSVAALRQNAL